MKCNYGENCRQSHDIKAWLEKKPNDINTTCYVFRTFGKCPFGLNCRFSSDHIKLNYNEFFSGENTSEELNFENVNFGNYSSLLISLIF